MEPDELRGKTVAEVLATNTPLANKLRRERAESLARLRRDKAAGTYPGLLDDIDLDADDSGDYRFGERFVDSYFGPAWHADGTPYSDEDYRRAGMDVPTPEQKAAWAKLDAEQEQARREGRPIPLWLGHRP